MQNKEMIFAHRGLYGEKIPENSLLAFEKAVSAGIGIELDVRLSSDGVPMVFHDRTLKRMCGDSRQVLALTADELKRLHLDGTDMKIPTLEEVLELVDGRCRILIETKLPKRYIWHKRLERSIIPLLKAYKGDYMLQSFNKYSVRYLKRKLPEVKCGILSGAAYPEPDGFDFVSYKLTGLTRSKVGQLRKSYSSIIAWGMGKKTMEECLEVAGELGIDGIIF